MPAAATTMTYVDARPIPASRAYRPGRTLPPPGLVVRRPRNDLVHAMTLVMLLELLVAGISPDIHEPAAVVHRAWLAIGIPGLVVMLLWDRRRLRAIGVPRPGIVWALFPPGYGAARARALHRPVGPAVPGMLVVTAGWIVALASLVQLVA